MKHTILLAPILIPFALCKTSGQLCRGTAELSDGNWYCTEVQAITYRNLSQAGAYNRTISVNPSTGICGHERVDYPAHGTLTPLFGEVSMHLRGPMNISQLAVYQLPSEIHASRRRSVVPFYNRRRARARYIKSYTEASANSSLLATQTWFPRFHPRASSTVSSLLTSSAAADAGAPCPANLDDRPEWNTTYDGPPLPCISLPTSMATYSDKPLSTTPSHLNDPMKENTLVKRAADWTRVAHYTSAAPSQATGLTFMANLGDPRKSGTFDYAFGNSLGYVTPDGGKVAAESLPFDGTLDTSEQEIVVFSDKECDHDCPYWRPNATSHYGWSGSSKAFFIEFQMDHHDNKGTDQGLISDAPAWWFLNAAIPRVLQYGNDRNNIPCSCWSTGCGEFDAFEVLGKGEDRAKSTIHRQGNLEGGDSNYFKRPVGRTMKFAVVWHFPHITALVLDDDFDFSATISNEQIQSLVSYDPSSWVHSLFAIGD
ncbi:target of Sbf [Coniothyrium glycines]